MLNSRSKSNPALSSSSDWIENRHLKSANGCWSYLSQVAWSSTVVGATSARSWVNAGGDWGWWRDLWVQMSVVKRVLFLPTVFYLCDIGVGTFFQCYEKASWPVIHWPWHPLDLWPQVFQHAVQLAWRQLPHCHSFGFVAFHPQAVNGGVVCWDAFQSIACSTVCLCRLCIQLLHMHTLCMPQVWNECVRTRFPYVCHKS